MIARPLQALLCDLDGTLIPDDGRLPEATRRRLDALEARGVRVMLATGRSEGGVLPLLDVLELETPALVYNGAALFCPRERRMLEERVLSGRTVERTLALARSAGLFPVVMRGGRSSLPSRATRRRSEPCSSWRTCRW